MTTRQGQGEPETSPRRLTTAERRDAAFARRKQGWTFEAIGQELGVTRQTAHKLVKAALAQLPPLPELAEFRRMELETSSDLIAAMWPKVAAEDPEAVRAVARVLEYRARLTGSFVSPSLNSLDLPAVQGAIEALVQIAIQLMPEEQRRVFMGEVERRMLALEPGGDR